MILSFIIPLFNCEKYIFRCLEQICSSGVDYYYFEIIVINDGSNDGSDREIQRFKSEYSSCNLIYIVTDNRGASDARNRGIEEAKGEYIWFVDADDLINPSFFSTITKRLKESDEDLICFNHAVLIDGGLKENKEFTEELYLSGVELLNRHTYNYVWNKIFKHSFIANHRFLHGIRNTEDWLFIMTSIVKTNKISCIPEVGYYYNTNNNGSTLRNRTLDNLMKNYADTQLVHETLLRFIHQQNNAAIINILKKTLNNSVISFFYAMFVDKMPKEYVSSVLLKYHTIGLYPPLKTNKKKAELFRKFLSMKSLFLIVLKMRENNKSH